MSQILNKNNNNFLIMMQLNLKILSYKLILSLRELTAMEKMKIFLVIKIMLNSSREKQNLKRNRKSEA